VTGAGGGVAETAVYRPFGEQQEWALDASAAGEDKGFIGERYDADAGLQYLNARYYDPKLGLFLQPDWWEVSEPGVGTNRYSYSFNDPVNLSDPGGNKLKQPEDEERDKDEDITDDESYEVAQTTSNGRGGTRLGVVSSPGGGVRAEQARQLMLEIQALHQQVHGRPHSGWVTGPSGSQPSQQAVNQLRAERDALAREAARRPEWSQSAYSVLFEAQLPPGLYPGIRPARHFQAANQQLYEAMSANPGFARQLESMYPGITAGVQPGARGAFPRTPPTQELTWHHNTFQTGNMQLVPRSQHQATGPAQQLLHPGGAGGYRVWGR
jgi:RHS repeat-associated protein